MDRKPVKWNDPIPEAPKRAKELVVANTGVGVSAQKRVLVMDDKQRRPPGGVLFAHDMIAYSFGMLVLPEGEETASFVVPWANVAQWAPVMAPAAEKKP